jgi:hypothetical protein
MTDQPIVVQRIDDTFVGIVLPNDYAWILLQVLTYLCGGNTGIDFYTLPAKPLEPFIQLPLPPTASAVDESTSVPARWVTSRIAKSLFKLHLKEPNP